LAFVFLLGASASAQRICPDGPIVNGIDVSRYQGVVDWAAVRQSGRSMAIARVSDGTRFRDAQFPRNWSVMALRGFVRGAYQYFRAGQDPIAQADLFLSYIQNDPIGWGDLPPVMDIETSDGQPASVVRANMWAWLTYMQDATGTTPIIYTANFMSSVIGPEFGWYYPLWVANWGVTCPLMPSGWSSWVIWQHSSTGRVSGVPGNVDLDRFNGSLQDLFDYVGDPAWRSGALAPEEPIPEDDLSQPGGSVMGDGIRAYQARGGDE
jgi:lysozyme